MSLEAYYNDSYGILIILDSERGNTRVDYLDTFVEAWHALNAHGYEASGFKRVFMDENLGEALMATDLERCEPFEGNP